jgi:NTP pyrophosphohydrolases containing a Zn-finger, probably nucleic-acid-binding
MIQDIHPHRINLEFGVRQPVGTDYIIALSQGKALLGGDAEQPSLVRHADIENILAGIAGQYVYLFTLDDAAFFFFDGEAPETAEFTYRNTVAFRSFQPSWLGFAGITAVHLAGWYGLNRFCGACGASMAQKTDERAMACGCGNVVYPRISPAVIVAVMDGDRVLMTRYANRPGSKRTALIAGFMEVGETFEDTVRREVMEEVGLRVKNIRYYKSQPWAFSSSVLTGFFCDLDGSPDIVLDTNELQEGAWVARSELQEADISVSLTSEMVDVFRRGAVPPHTPLA